MKTVYPLVLSNVKQIRATMLNNIKFEIFVEVSTKWLAMHIEKMISQWAKRWQTMTLARNNICVVVETSW